MTVTKAPTSTRPLATHTRIGRVVVLCLAQAVWPRVGHGQEAKPAPPPAAPGQEIAASPPAAAGQEATPPPAALAHYQRGREHYQAGRYREALIELELAMQLDPNSPNLVYNVARVYELLGEIDHAIAFYKRFRDMLPPEETAERERVALTLQRLDGAREQVEVPRRPAAPHAPELKRGVADGTFWLFAGATVLTLAGAGATGLLALDAEAQAEQLVLGEDGAAKRREHLSERADKLALASDSLLLAGATLGVTSLLLYVLRHEPVRSGKRAALDVAVSPLGAFIGLRGAL
jgi:tetratricopeptide (TPR) repeat protein